MNVEQLDGDGRWWRIGSYEVDTRADEGTYPGNVRARALAHRDATDDESHDVAAILAADVEMGEQRPLPITAGWLFAQAQKIQARIWAHIHQLEEKHHEHAA